MQGARPSSSGGCSWGLGASGMHTAVGGCRASVGAQWLGIWDQGGVAVELSAQLNSVNVIASTPLTLFLDTGEL